MTGLFRILTAASALLGAPAAAQDAPSPPSDPQIETIEAQADFHQRLTIPVTIGGEGPFRFMVDTGAQATSITREVGERLALEPAGRATLVGMASRKVVDLVDLDGLAIGSRTMDNIAAPVLEAAHVGADGIIGLDSLQDLRVLLDFRGDALHVADAKDLGGNRGYDIIVRARRKLGQLIITNAEIEGVRTALIIDTGAQGSMGNLALREKLRKRRMAETTATDILGATIAGQLGIAKSVRIAKLELNNVAISYVDAPAFAALGYTDEPALSLGMEHLRLFDRVAIDFDTRRVLFDLPRGAELVDRNWTRRF